MTVLEQYEKFFRLQGRDKEREYEEYANTPLNSLFAKGRAFYGNIVGTTEYGQMVLQFETKITPRLKVPMVMCVIIDGSYKNYGKDIATWSCNSVDYYKNYEAHSALTDILPIFYLNNRKMIGCGQVSIEMLSAVKRALAAQRPLKYIMLEKMPPTEMLFNLAEYIKGHPQDRNLTLTAKSSYDEWHPIELKSTDDVTGAVVNALETSDICVLQGPPGTGKSYTLGSIISKMTKDGKSVCVTTQSNASLISLISQDTTNVKGAISKTVLSAEEKKKYPFLIPADKDLLVAKGSLLCSTYYSLSRIINKVEKPIYDLIVIEEASQAFLTTIAAFKQLGTKCLIVGDPMQLPPIVDIINANDYDGIDIGTQTNGLMTFVCSENVPSIRMTTSFRLTPQSTSQSKYFYGGTFTSIQPKKTIFNVPNEMKPFFPSEGGTIIYNSQGSISGNCSKSALELIKKIVGVFTGYYPKRRLAILSPFVDTTKSLQTEFCNDDQKLDLLVDTVSRIQGETVDYTIYYLPARNHRFAFSENLFNVATSRSKSTTLLITDMPLDIIQISSTKVKRFLDNCNIVDMTQKGEIDRDSVKQYYPGLEDLVDLLLDNNVKFSLDGDVDLLDHNDIVIASAGMILSEKNIVIDPVDNDSKIIFEKAGYRVISSTDFNINDIK